MSGYRTRLRRIFTITSKITEATESGFIGNSRVVELADMIARKAVMDISSAVGMDWMLAESVPSRK